MTLSSPYEGLCGPTESPRCYIPVQDAERAWKFRHRYGAAADALTPWTSTTAADGRPCHTARVDCSDAVNVLTDFVNSSPAGGVHGDQQRPVLDYSVEGRIGCLWLLDGEWIELWAADTPAPQTVPRPRAGVTPAMADKLLGASLRPSGRLPFTRRTKKERPAA